MKRMKFAALLAALFSISIAVTGCGGSEDEGPKVGGPGAPGFGSGLIPGVQVPTGDGGMSYGFSGSNVYTDNSFITAGPAAYSTYSGTFYYGTASWAFSQAMTTRYYTCSTYGSYQPIPLTMLSASGGVAVSAGYTTYVGPSTVEPGANLSLLVGAPSCGVSQVQGTLTLPPAFIQRNPTAFPNGNATPIAGITIDLRPGTCPTYSQLAGCPAGQPRVNGGILIYTVPNGSGGYKGAFLAL